MSAAAAAAAQKQASAQQQQAQVSLKFFFFMAGPAEKIKVPRNFRLLDEFDHRFLCAARQRACEFVLKSARAAAIAMRLAVWG
jgi:hypothetical protein